MDISLNLIGLLVVPPFNGDRTTTTYQYKKWREKIEVFVEINGPRKEELAQLIYNQFTGRARTLLNCLRFASPAEASRRPEAMDRENSLGSLWGLWIERIPGACCYQRFCFGVALGSLWGHFWASAKKYTSAPATSSSPGSSVDGLFGPT